MDQFLAVLFAVIPIIILIASGLGMRACRLMTKAGSAEIGKVVYWLALPCLLFYKMAIGEENDTPWLGLGIGTILFTVSCFLAFFTTKSLGPKAQGTYATMSFRSNCAFVGLPVAVLLIKNGIIDSSFEQYFLIMLACTVPVFNVLSVAGFLLPHHGIDKRAIKHVCMGLLKNPLIWSCLLGILFSKLGWGIAIKDNVLMESCSLIGQAAIPMALIMAGANLQVETLRGGGNAFWFWTVWKMILLPAAALLVCYFLQLDLATTLALIIICASPSAVATVPMAQELGGDAELTSTGVVITTIICPVSLVAFILIAQMVTHV